MELAERTSAQISIKKYHHSAKGKRKLKETQDRYNMTQKGYDRMKKYWSKPFYCDFCNMMTKIGSKCTHFKTMKHKINFEKHNN